MNNIHLNIINYININYPFEMILIEATLHITTRNTPNIINFEYKGKQKLLCYRNMLLCDHQNIYL